MTIAARTDFMNIRQEPTRPDPGDFIRAHRASRAGDFGERIVCSCGSIAVPDYNLKGWIDEAARRWMDSPEGVAWFDRGGTDAEVPESVHFYPFEQEEDAEEDERRADLSFAAQRRAEKALQDEQSAYARGYRHAQALYAKKIGVRLTHGRPDRPSRTKEGRHQEYLRRKARKAAAAAAEAQES